MIEVIVDARRQVLLLPPPHDYLAGETRRPPIKVEGELVGFDQMTLGVTTEVEEEVDVTGGARPIIGQLLVAYPAGAPGDRTAQQRAYTGAVPVRMAGGLAWRHRPGRYEGTSRLSRRDRC